MARVHHFRSSSCALALLSLVVAGCTPTGSTDKAKAPPRVTVAHPVVRELTDEDDYNGWLEAYATVDVRSRVRGHIQAIHFKDGDFVTKGQLLFELDPRPFQVEIDRETANARALDAQKIAAKKDLARYTELVKTGAASRQDVDKAQADADSYDARIAALLEQIKGHELDLQYSRIAADLAGKIGKANLSAGNLVNAGGTDPVLATIVSVDPIYVDFNVDERAMQSYQRSGLGRGTRAGKCRCASGRSPSRSDWTRKKASRTRVISFSPTISTPRARARSSSAALLKTPTAL